MPAFIRALSLEWALTRRRQNSGNFDLFKAAAMQHLPFSELSNNH